MNVKQRVRIVLPAVAVLAVGIWLGLRLRTDRSSLEASGTVEATEADLGFQVAGRIEGIMVREGDRVQDGQELAYLDRAELDARRRAAEAQVAAARARLTELQRGYRSEEIAQGRAALRSAEQRQSDAQRDLARMQNLFEGGAVSQQALDDQQTALDLAEAEQEQAVERLRILERGPRAEQIAAQQAALEQTQATVEQIAAILQHAVVTAPFAGLVTVRHREPGESVAPGTPVITIMNPDDRWIRIYIREDAVGRVSIGQRAAITADAYRDRTYGGETTFIASEAEFTPRNVQTTEERVKLVYEVRVRITDDPSFDLKPGLAADVALQPETP
jgi:HlyD family secretion protein